MMWLTSDVGEVEADEIPELDSLILRILLCVCCADCRISGCCSSHYFWSCQSGSGGCGMSCQDDTSITTSDHHHVGWISRNAADDLHADALRIIPQLVGDRFGQDGSSGHSWQPSFHFQPSHRCCCWCFPSRMSYCCFRCCSWYWFQNIHE